MQIQSRVKSRLKRYRFISDNESSQEGEKKKYVNEVRYIYIVKKLAVNLPLDTQVYIKARKYYKALSDKLGDKLYFFGDRLVECFQFTVLILI